MDLESEFFELQRKLAGIDLLTNPRPGGQSDFIESSAVPRPGTVSGDLQLRDGDRVAVTPKRIAGGFQLVKLRNLKIKMYQETNHSSPHLHIDYGREHHVASFSIKPPRRLAGNLDRKYERLVLAWITEYCDRLVEVWDAVQAGENPGAIIAELTGSE